MGLEEDYDNSAHARMGANTAGQVASVLAGGIVLAIMTGLIVFAPSRLRVLSIRCSSSR